MHLADLRSYLQADERVIELYRAPARKSILNVAGSEKIFERPHRCGIRLANLARAALPCGVSFGLALGLGCVAPTDDG